MANFPESEDIDFHKSTIRENAAQRGLAKLRLKSFWDKLTEMNNWPKMKMLADPQDLFRSLSTPGIEVTNLLIAGEEVLWVKCKYVEEYMPVLRYTNNVIGTYLKTEEPLKIT